MPAQSVLHQKKSWNNMLSYNDLKQIAETRLSEARVLFEHHYFDGAAYLCGYVLEAAIKARICKNLNIQEYPKDNDLKNFFYSHDFDRLILLAGLQNEINMEKNPAIFTNWSLLTAWKPEKRYVQIGTNKQEDVEALFLALEDGDAGLLTWLKSIW